MGKDAFHSFITFFQTLSHLFPLCLPFLSVSDFFSLFSARHWEALTLINGEPSSALKARGSKWGQIKVEQGGKGWEGWRGEKERRTQSPITVSIIVPGWQWGTQSEGTAVLHWAEPHPHTGTTHCLWQALHTWASRTHIQNMVTVCPVGLASEKSFFASGSVVRICVSLRWKFKLRYLQLTPSILIIKG